MLFQRRKLKMVFNLRKIDLTLNVYLGFEKSTFFFKCYFLKKPANNAFERCCSETELKLQNLLKSPNPAFCYTLPTDRTPTHQQSTTQPKSTTNSSPFERHSQTQKTHSTKKARTFPSANAFRFGVEWRRADGRNA